MPQAIGVTLTTGTPTLAQWCDEHALPHLLTVPVLMLTPHGVTDMRTYRICHE